MLGRIQVVNRIRVVECKRVFIGIPRDLCFIFQLVECERSDTVKFLDGLGLNWNLLGFLYGQLLRGGEEVIGVGGGQLEVFHQIANDGWS